MFATFLTWARSISADHPVLKGVKIPMSMLAPKKKKQSIRIVFDQGDDDELTCFARIRVVGVSQGMFRMG